MELTMREKQAVTRKLSMHYKKARKKEKGKILDELMALTGYHRGHARRVLRQWSKRIRFTRDGQTIVVLPGTKRKEKHKRKRIYAQDEFVALKRLWCWCDGICGKRLAPYLKEFISVCELHNEIRLSPSVREKLVHISAATLDRMLKHEKRKMALKGRSKTKPGTLLKHQIPIRTYADWNEQKPGFMEMDLVGHDGGTARGEYNQTLDMTDIFTGWTEIQAVKNKAQKWVFEALKDIRARLPFPLLGVDSDNGSEFINDPLVRYCEQEHITFSRSRPYRKNDNCYVEQKNFSVVRRFAGYARYETDEELKLLNALYHEVGMFVNFFQPVRKLLSKERQGSRVRKTYDLSRTPYQRVREHPQIDKKVKSRLTRHYRTLNPVELKRRISTLQARLMRLTTFKETVRKYVEKTQQKPNPISRTI